MSLKHLARFLMKLKDFDNPIIELEQYTTPGDVAAELLWSANMKGLVKNKEILDLGAGTGILGIGALLLGAKKVIFLETDTSAIKILKENLTFVENHYEIGAYEISQRDVSSAKNFFDLVIMNPPFGTKTKRADFVFLTKAFSLSNNILTIHKSSTKQFILKTISENKFLIEDIFDFKYPLKKTFEHHNKLVRFIEVSGFLIKKKTGE